MINRHNATPNLSNSRVGLGLTLATAAALTLGCGSEHVDASKKETVKDCSVRAHADYSINDQYGDPVKRVSELRTSVNEKVTSLFTRLSATNKTIIIDNTHKSFNGNNPDGHIFKAKATDAGLELLFQGPDFHGYDTVTFPMTDGKPAEITTATIVCADSETGTLYPNGVVHLLGMFDDRTAGMDALDK